MIDPADIQNIKQRFGIVGNAQILNYAIQIAMQVAPTELNVLITGENGTGKESFSKIIHQLSTRKHGQFIALNCGAIPEGTIYSELFGHEKGAFTGAVEAKKGYFEVTDGGTIFLDEIGEMPMEAQAMLLRVLESGEFIRMGSTKVAKTNVRVIAATNVKLQQAIENKKFREDLYYRLSTVPIYVPPLRERGNDILLLFRKFATDFSEKYRVDPIKLPPEAAQLLLNYSFPGNVRQLKNITEQISLIEYNREINAETLQKYLPKIPTNQHNRTPILSYESQENSNNFSEREIFYRFLVDMKKDVNELKKLFLQVLQKENINWQDLMHNHSELFDEVNPEEFISKTPTLLPEPPNYEKTTNVINLDENATINTQDIQHEEAEEDTLSLEEQEKELILKALRKNKNRRKQTARDLGISERTLYRKLKQYDLEDIE
ncbi:MAG: sigma-54-dependent Fis family transcriptional regulator [Cytophagales bacterium]|nr:MAG: sigma-54-dependent Fis family transcriptional regulator [Cytophagales bacterium]